MSFRLCTLATVLLLTISGTTFAQQDFSKVEIKTTHVNGTVYMLEGSGGNIAVSAGEDGFLMVDDQFAPLADKIRAAMNEVGTGDLRFLLNTHHHGDHTSANHIFGSEATIIAHDNVRKRLADKPKAGWPIITFASSLSIHFNGEEIKAIHFANSHTDGDAVIHFTKSNVIHLGDMFFNGMFPYVDIESGGNALELSRNIGEFIKSLPDDIKVIPGHGPLGTIDDLQNYHNMLEETIGIVSKSKESGKSLDDIKAAGLPDKWSSWSWSFVTTERWIEAIYNSL